MVCHPEREAGNYVPRLIPRRYDAFIFLDETSVLHLLYLLPGGHPLPETFPFGV